MNSPIIFWTAVGASATIGSAIGALIGAFVAWRQLRRISVSSGGELILKLYELFDGESHRENRRKIWQEIKIKRIKYLTRDEWVIIERTATEMDVVGTLLKYRHIPEGIIFERYAEVIIPLWDVMSSYVLHRREEKGGFGWNNFEWMAEEARKWSLKHRNVDTYKRFTNG